VATALTRDLRADVLRRLQLAKLHHGRVKAAVHARVPLDEDALQRLRASEAFLRRCALEYFEGLPRVVMSTCPHCAGRLERAFDPFDLDGDWWQGARHERPSHCRHYTFLRGAVRFAGGPLPTPPSAGTARAGPEVPYVIPRLLEQPTMIAVIGELPMDPGWTAYTVAYFAKRRPRTAKGFSGDWAARTARHRSETTRKTEERYASEPWDFDLQPWIDRGRLRWCLQGSANRILAEAGARGCPYVRLVGERRPLELDPNVPGQRIAVPHGEAEPDWSAG
jgi:hypothetical protein